MLTHLNGLPQGAVERDRRTPAMVAAMDDAGFGACSDPCECAAVCPMAIDLPVFARMNGGYAAALTRRVLNF